MNKIRLTLLSGFALLFASASAQTESDAIMMNRNNFCTGFTYSYNSWKEYWEGENKRENLNIGKVSTSAITLMGNYGIRNNLNFIFSLPYVETKASAGTLNGQSGVQDISAYLKWMFVEPKLEKGDLSLYAVLGGSVPSNNYIADYLPLSIGLKSATANLRLIADYEINHWFITVSGNYIFRNNITIDRTAYYTEEMIYSDEVYMPNVFSSKVGLGYRKGDLILEGVFDTYNTLGGFDIRKNDMPFPSNEMDMIRAGVNVKIPINAINGLSVVANAIYTLDGRNVGQTTYTTAGIFYVFDFTGKEKTSSQQTTPAPTQK